MRNSFVEGLRFQRQMQFAPIGKKGQKLISSAKVLIIGAGALGASLAEMASRIGVGRIVIVDRDFVEISNLPRQACFSEEDARENRPKVEALATHLKSINSSIEVTTLFGDFTLSYDSPIFDEVSVVLDGTDNFSTRVFINSWCLEKGIPWVHGACVALRGVAAAFSSKGKPCFVCLYPSMPPAEAIETCETEGIVVPIARVIPALQIVLLLRVLLKKSCFGRFKYLDLWEEASQSFLIPARDDCLVCAKGKRPHRDGRELRAESICGKDSVLVIPPFDRQIEMVAFSSRFSKGDVVRMSPWFTEIRVDSERLIKIFPDGRAILSGTSDIEQALAIYSRLTGL